MSALLLLYLLSHQPDFLLLELQEGPGPWRQVSYHFWQTGDTVALCSRKAMALRDRDFVRCTLISPSRMARIHEDVNAILPTMPSQPATREILFGGLWSLDSWNSTHENRLFAQGSLHSPSDAFSQAAAMIIREAEKLLGREVYRDPLLPEKDYGTVSIWTRPRAMIVINDISLDLKSPVLGLELPMGKHRIRLQTQDGRLQRSGHIEVKAGKNTNYFLELYPQAQGE